MKQHQGRMQGPAAGEPAAARTDHDNFVDAPPDFRFPVVRTRLMADLAGRALQRPCGLATVETLLSPHGWGKTVILAEVFRAWRRDAGLPGVWLGLGYLDDDLDTVILQLSRQIAAWVPGMAPGLTAEHGPIYGVQDQILRPLLENVPLPFLICIDNIDNCTESLAPGALDALFDTAPPGVHFLLTSNRSLGYDRVEAMMRGALREHGTTELAFADAEACEMLGRTVQVLGPEVLPALLERAEGWAAGLRLVAMLLDAPAGGAGMLSRFSGAAPGLRDWFDRKVLAAMPPQMHRFLLFASLLPSFEPGQVGKVIGAGDVQKHMDSMLAQGMFIVPVAGRCNRFRMHQLLRDRLRAEAEQTVPEPERTAFCREMAQLAAEDRLWDEAISAARSSRSDSLIAQVLERAAPSLVRDMCRMRYFVEVVDELIAAGVPLGFETRYWHVFALTFYLRHASAGRHLEQLRSMACDDAGGCSLVHRVEHLSVALAFLRDDLPVAGRHARQWLESGHDKDPFDHAWVLSVMAAYHLTAYRFAETRDCLWRARGLAHEVRSPYLTGWCDLILGASYLYEGNVFRGREIIDQALARAEQALGADADLCDLISSVASKCAVEAGNHGKARELLARALRSMHKHGNVGTSMCAVDAALQLWDGDEHDPVFLRLKAVVPRYSFRLRLMFSCYLIRRLVSLGRVADAQAEAAAIGLDLAEGRVRLAGGELLPRTRDIIVMTAIELLLGIGDSGAARKLAEREREAAEHDGRALRQARLELVLMALARQRGDDAEAANRLRTALLLARRRQMVEAFRRHRPDIDALLASRAFGAEHFPNPDDRAFLSRLLAHLGIEEPGSSTESPRPADAGVPLTGRERELMRLVQSGLSNPEICEVMNLSRNTVKWHLKNIFIKLNVPNRTVAAMVYSE